MFSRSPPGLSLKSSRKQKSENGSDLARTRTVKETLNRIVPVCAKIGVTRVTDITYMDRLYLPNYSAILPGTNDTFWVYSGKGPTKESARASAIMEAIERYSSLSGSRPKSFIQGKYSQLSQSFSMVHPGELVELVNEQFDEKHTTLDFTPGFDLLNNEMVLVPTELVLYKYSPAHPAGRAFLNSHTNGLASGNVLEEAVCHALCEVIERDAISLADLCASAIPYNILSGINDIVKKEHNFYPVYRLPIDDIFVDDPSLFPDVDISQIAEEFMPLKILVKRFYDVGITLLIKDITQKDIGIPSFAASSIEWITQDYGLLARGFGTHPDTRIALIRAITEVSQTRAINIHGARDDLRRIQYRDNDDIYKRKWQFMPSTYPNGIQNCDNNITRFPEIKTYVYDDILDDIHLILSRLKNAGLKRAIIIDLTHPNIGIPVVRAIIPGLETFEVQNSIMGRRARECFARLGSIEEQT